MNFNLKRPCRDCPFRSDKVFLLHPERVEEIIESITDGDGTFPCHKTVDYDSQDPESDYHCPSKKEEHCAGATILLEKIGQPNQMMRIAERLRVYDRTKMDMSAPVYGDPEEMIDAITELWENNE